MRDLWASRSLVVWFGRKFIERMYANSLLGWWWVPLRPLLAIVPRALIFGGVLNAPSNGTPYLLFFVVGHGAWELMDRGWYVGTRCFQMSGKYLKRMYLPRLAPLVGCMGPAIVMYLLFCVFTTLVVGYYVTLEDHFPLDLGLQTLLLPAGLVLILALALSLSLWTSIFGAHGRDARWTVRAVLGVWMLLTPVIYPLSAVPDGFQTVAQINPMTAPMEMVRQALFGNADVTTLSLAVTVATIAVVGSLGFAFFNRSESTALDYT